MTRLRLLLLLVALLVGGILLFSNSSSAYFVSDDWHWLWSADQREGIFPDLLANYAGERVGGSYNPVSSLWINSFYAFAGLNPFPYHIGSIILHSITAWLVGLLLFIWLKIFRVSDHSEAVRMSVATAASVLFFVWPTHVEAVNWIASVPHLLATLFYLLAIIYYLQWRRSNNWNWFAVAVVSALLSLFSKEIAVSLPLVLIGIEFVYQKFIDRQIRFTKYLIHLFFLGASLFYLIMRFMATQLWLGTYADERLIVRTTTWLHTFFTFFEEMLSLGLLRGEWSSFYFDYPQVGWSVALLIVVALIIYLLWKKFHGSVIFLTLFILTTLPFIPLGFNRLSAESERYTFLPSVFFIAALTLFLVQLKNKRAQLFIVGFLIASSIVFVWNKNTNWVTAGNVSKQIITEFSQHQEETVEKYVFVLLPDTLSGAHVFRNNIHEALRLVYPDLKDEVVQIPVYIQLTNENYDQEIVTWRSDDRGLFAENKQGLQVITGIDREETDLMTYELWNYDYTNFSSDTVRLIFSDDFKKEVLDGSVKILTWQQGRLHAL